MSNEIVPHDLMPGVMRAAIFIMNLPKEDAAQVMKHLGPKQVQKLGIAMADLEKVDKEQLDMVMQEFIDQVQRQTSLGIDSDEYIREVLTNALGQEKAGGMLDRILKGGNTKGLDTLKWMEARAVADIIRLEHPQIQSIVLSYLDPDHAAEVIAFFDERIRLDLILRISNLESVHPVALQELNDIMEKQFSGKASTATKQVGGLQTAANIMNFVDSAIETELMTQIKEHNPDLGQNIQDLMFVFDNLVDVDDRDIQKILREVSTEMLVLALKGADTSVKEKIFRNMSKRASELLRDDLDAKGPVRVSEVEAAQKDVLSIARRLADSGEITLGIKAGEEMI
jgi:flagellar motor switch protein FliG